MTKRFFLWNILGSWPKQTPITYKSLDSFLLFFMIEFLPQVQPLARVLNKIYSKIPETEGSRCDIGVFLGFLQASTMDYFVTRVNCFYCYLFLRSSSSSIFEGNRILLCGTQRTSKIFKWNCFFKCLQIACLTASYHGAVYFWFSRSYFQTKIKMSKLHSKGCTIFY